MISSGARAVVTRLDQLRALFLDATLRYPPLRRIFVSRASRLRFQFFTSLIWQLPIAVLLPIPMLILGPILFGVPHLVSSLRHGVGHPHSVFTSQRTFVTLILAIWSAVGFARYFDGFDHPLVFECAGMLLTFALAWVFRRAASRLWGVGALALIALAIVISLQPMLMVGFLVLFHNFVGFFHWWKGTRATADRRTVALCFTGFVVAHAVIFAGAFDTWIGQGAFSGMDVLSFTPTFAAWSGEGHWVARAVVAYAIGQSMHYFVWLKCIPDQHHTTEMSTSFRQSLRLLERDFGSRAVSLMIVASFGMIGLALLLPSEKFRLIYFSTAAFHGFLEIAGLFFGWESPTPVRVNS